MRNFKVIGLMSGTSLDGLDIAYCEFAEHLGRWDYEIVKATTLDYSDDLKDLLRHMYVATAQDLIEMDRLYGRYLGEEVQKFIATHHLKVDFISSHGHTVFHRPDKGYTYQAGSGAEICAIANVPVVSDFRSLDVALKGQGAPLVPIGDRLLFAEFDMCLNLGGIANISFEKEGKRGAFDICAVNMVLNSLAGRLGKEYDSEGVLAKKGKVLKPVLHQLQQLDYYKSISPKSMGKEWVDEQIFPLLSLSENTEDLLRTFCHHISLQINAVVNTYSEKSLNTQVLVTGGGAFNHFLMETMQQDANDHVQYIIPEKKIIMFKEALIFAFLGVLRVINQPNALAAVTGASHDHVGGALYGDFSKL